MNDLTSPFLRTDLHFSLPSLLKEENSSFAGSGVGSLLLLSVSLRILIHCILCCIVSDKKSVVILIFVHIQVMCLSCSLNFFSFSNCTTAIWLWCDLVWFCVYCACVFLSSLALQVVRVSDSILSVFEGWQLLNLSPTSSPSALIWKSWRERPSAPSFGELSPGPYPLTIILKTQPFLFPCLVSQAILRPPWEACLQLSRSFIMCVVNCFRSSWGVCVP